MYKDEAFNVLYILDTSAGYSIHSTVMCSTNDGLSVLSNLIHLM